MGCVIDAGYTLEEGLQAVGPGWASLVKVAFEQCPAGVRIIQVKEKFGGLRMYCEGPEELEQLLRPVLRQLEDASYQVCEVCGAAGGLRKEGGWWATRCEAHLTHRC